MPDSFVHLHVHTEYSMLDGASRISDLVSKAKQDGQPAIGITDHGNMYGTIEFYKECVKAGIKPILGIEAYMAHENVADRPTRRGIVDDSGGETSSGQKLYYHLTLLAKNNSGYKNLIQLSSRSFLEGYYYKPRVDWNILSEHAEGLIATTGCLGSQVNQFLLNDNYDEALKRAGKLREIFGKENLFVELQDHGIAAQKQTMPELLEIAKTLDLSLLATNDCHYTNRDDAHAHDALLCLQTGSEMQDENRFRFEGEEHFMKTAQEMRERFKQWPEACDSSLDIGDACNVEIGFGEPKLPHFPVPSQYSTQDEYLKELVIDGAKKRWGTKFNNSTGDPIKDRLEYELKIISDMGFSAYFLIIWDLVKYAKSQNIRVGPGRGSAAGCCVAYSLGITEVDPIKYNLLFERFLNPARRQMPDIDLDFDSRYREELIRYLSDKYGYDHVAQIITFSKLKARAAVRDAARVLGHKYSLGDQLVEAMPPMVMGRTTPLAACLEEQDGYFEDYKKAAGFREHYENTEGAKEVIDVAMGLENLCRQDSIHAAAVVITAEPLTEYLPIQQKPTSSSNGTENSNGTISKSKKKKRSQEDAPIVTQYEMHAVEELGLLKMDLLGLRNLDVISETLKIIEETTGEKLEVESINLEDQKTFELLKRSDTMGVFQLESDTMRSLMVALSPDSIDDVAALVALHRPGPMEANMHLDFADRKNGRKEVEYLHPDAEEILGETYGLMIYQESMMLIAQKFAGYSASEAEDLRKACGKKIRAIMSEQREKFIEGCKNTIGKGNQKPYGEELGKKWWEQIEPFADYAFNKSHSYGYGLVAYQTAYLKANYPVQFMAAQLTSMKNNVDRMGLYLAECKRMDLEILLPDINISESDFTVHLVTEGKDGIPFGLTAIRNVGNKVVELIIEERKANGDYVDFYDFCNRVDTSVLNKKTLESLIFAGAFDSLRHSRKGLLESFETILEHTMEARAEDEIGAVSMFSGAGLEKSISEIVSIGVEEFPKAEKLSREKEVLGWYVSDHPLFNIGKQIRENSDCTIGEFVKKQNDEKARLCGIASRVKVKQTKKGQTMATMVLEDLENQVEAFIFPQVWERIEQAVVEDAILVVSGRLKREDEDIKIVLDDAKPLVVRKIEGRNETMQNQSSTNNGQSIISKNLSSETKKALPEENVNGVKNGTGRLEDEIQNFFNLIDERDELFQDLETAGLE